MVEDAARTKVVRPVVDVVGELTEVLGLGVTRLVTDDTGTRMACGARGATSGPCRDVFISDGRAVVMIGWGARMDSGDREVTGCLAAGEDISDSLMARCIPMLSSRYNTACFARFRICGTWLGWVSVRATASWKSGDGGGGTQADDDDDEAAGGVDGASSTGSTLTRLNMLSSERSMGCTPLLSGGGDDEASG